MPGPASHVFDKRRRRAGARCRRMRDFAVLCDLESAVVYGAAAADVRRVFGVKPCTERLVLFAVPDTRYALRRHVAEAHSIRRGNHAARHGLARERHIGAAPWPVAAL